MMENLESYEVWKESRRIAPPVGFSDRVMAAIGQRQIGEDGRLASRSARLQWLLALTASRLGRVVVCSLAGAVCLLRLKYVVAMFLE